MRRRLLPVLVLLLGDGRDAGAAPSVAVPGFALTTAVPPLAGPTAIAFLSRRLVTRAIASLKAATTATNRAATRLTISFD